MFEAPELGIGMMYLPGLESYLEAGLPFLDVVEFEPQTTSGETNGRVALRAEAVSMLSSLPVPKLVHGVGAPIGGSHLPERLLRPFFEAIDLLNPPWASEHLTFNHFQVEDETCFTGFMLPPVQTTDSVAVAVQNVKRVQSGMSVPLAIETPVNYLRPRGFEMSDGSFIGTIAERADCGILLDLHNIWCNEQNGRQPVLDAINEMPKDRIWEIHLAAGRQIDGYWVDAHSGLIREPIWEIAEQVIPLLPNLKAVIFETMPEYLWDRDSSLQAFIDQFHRLRRLWDERGVRPAGHHHQSRRATEKSPGGSVAPREWEATLGSLVTGWEVDTAIADDLSSDPGTGIYRQLARSVRLGVITDTLRLSYRLIALSIGDQETMRLLGRYLKETKPTPLAIDEVRQFAGWLEGVDLPIAHVGQVLAFELATLDTHTDGVERTITFYREPLELLEGLGSGRLPEPSAGSERFELLVTP